MFSNKIAIFALLAATLVSAAPGGEPDGGSTSNVWNKTEKKCNVGTLQCCNQLQTSKAANANKQVALAGITVPSVAGLVGVSCIPLSIIGANTNSCSAQPACCKGNQMGGLVTLGCNPVNVAA